MLVAVAAAIALAAAWSAWSAAAERRHAQARVEQARRDAAAASSRLRAVGPLGGAYQGALARAELSASAPPVQALAAVSELLPPDLRLQSATLRYGRVLGLELQVAARRPEAYDLFLERLGASSRFSSVTPGMEERGGDELRASVQAEYREGGRP
jgi:hypothetical protein